MARDATATREQLLDAGRRLMAEHGPYQVPLKLIQEAAGQRNASALHYHFGGREGLLQAILDQHNATVEAARREHLDAIGEDATLDDLVRSVVLPMAAELASSEGRYFLRIVAHLADLFDLWDTDGPNVPVEARRSFRLISAKLDGLGPELRRLRVAIFLALVTGALAQRAALRSASGRPVVTDQDFLDNLVAMAVGALRG